jgi:hypothetical protein
MFNWNKKEKPVFTGIARGVGGFGFGSQVLIPVSSASNTGGVSATGGAIFEYTDSGSTYRIHVFANSDETFTYTSGPGSVDVLVVGGGGAGGRTAGDQDTGKGGGGAGGVAWAYQIPVSPGTTCPVTIGSGGTGSAQNPTAYPRPAAVVHQSGSPSTFIIPSGPYTITGTGGGGGGVSDTGPNPIPAPNTNAGDPGGSGGGAAARGTASTYNGGPATQPAQNPGMPWVSNYGFVGGFSNSNGGGSAGGGGGAGGQGTDSPGGGNGGAGGPGISNFINSSTSQTSAFLIAAHIGTDPNNAQVTPSSPAVSYIAGGGGGGTGTEGPDWTTSQGPGGVGGGGRAGAGKNVGQTGPTNSLLPNAYWPVVRGLEHTGGGGGGAADDPTNYTTGGYAGSGGKGVVIVRYSITNTSTGSFIDATGGSVSTSGNYKIHTFSHPNSPALSNYTGHTFNVTSLSNAPIYNTIEVLCVGGGGSGGMWFGAGGGGGGVAHTYSYPLPGAGSVPLSIPIQIGGGGAAIPSNPGSSGYAGGDSYFGPVSLRWNGLGGGAGGYGGNGVGGNPGGSGGGGGAPMNPGVGQGGRSTQRDVVNASNPNIVGYNYGNAGGNGAGPSGDAGGGGGAGSDGSPNGGNGGNGVAVSITGSSVTYGGGGGGANSGNSATGGSGGGGNGGGPSNGGDGTNGLGGGGGGAYTGASRSGQGGTGVVIVRYRYQ